MSAALDVRDVSKSYAGRTVVDGVSFSVAPGEVFGLVGPNGSGKTTTIRVALDIVRPDSGTVRLFGGERTRDALARVGYLPEERGLYQRARLTEVLRYLGRLKRMSARDAARRTDELLEHVGLAEHSRKKVQALSRGMTQLAQFAGALLHSPDLLVLDEPFSGLDPLNVHLMKAVIREEQARGAAIIFSTHQMVDVEELCERVALVNDGKLLLYGELQALKRARGTRTVRVQAGREPDIVAGAESRTASNGMFEYVMAGGAAANDVLRSFVEADIPVERYEEALPTLNEIFIDEVSRARDAR